MVQQLIQNLLIFSAYFVFIDKQIVFVLDSWRLKLLVFVDYECTIVILWSKIVSGFFFYKLSSLQLVNKNIASNLPWNSDILFDKIEVISVPQVATSIEGSWVMFLSEEIMANVIVQSTYSGKLN